MKIKGLPTEYIGDETFIIDSTRGYDFGVKKNGKYVLINEEDYHATRKLLEKICKQENYAVLEVLGIV